MQLLKLVRISIRPRKSSSRLPLPLKPCPSFSSRFSCAARLSLRALVLVPEQGFYEQPCDYNPARRLGLFLCDEHFILSRVQEGLLGRKVQHSVHTAPATLPRQELCHPKVLPPGKLLYQQAWLEGAAPRPSCEGRSRSRPTPRTKKRRAVVTGGPMEVPCQERSEGASTKMKLNISQAPRQMLRPPPRTRSQLRSELPRDQRRSCCTLHRLYGVTERHGHGSRKNNICQRSAT